MVFKLVQTEGRFSYKMSFSIHLEHHITLKDLPQYEMHHEESNFRDPSKVSIHEEDFREKSDKIVNEETEMDRILHVC